MRKKTKEKPLFIIGIIAFLYLVVVVFLSLIFTNRFGYGAEVGGIPVSLKTKADAIREIRARTEFFYNSSYTLDKKIYQTNDFVTGYDVEKSVDLALDAQQKEIPAFRPLLGLKQPLVVNFKTDNIQKILLKEYNNYLKPPEDARVDVQNSKVIPEKDSLKLLLADSRQALETDLAQGKSTTYLVTENLRPTLTNAEAALLIDKARQATASPVEIDSERGQFQIDSNTLISWLRIMPQTPRSLVMLEPLVPIDEQDFYYFDQTKVVEFVTRLAKNINQTKSNAKLAMVGGTITVTEPDVKGYVLDQEDAVSKIQNVAGKTRAITLKINEELPEVRRDNLSELGITELLSTGWSDFAGSPKNRIHNVSTGASKFNGALIRPDDNFSFNKVLGPVEAATGYLPELVILENKTTPQYGGGLCQVSSTAFRAALNAGFPILERTMHAYPVVYYRPYGVDATIYLPKPDLVFKNNSGHYVLIQTRIYGTKLYFDFFGTKPASTVKFAGNIKGAGAIYPVEQVNPGIYDQGAKGTGSFTASVYRFIYDIDGKLTRTDTFISKYDSPLKFPH